MSSENNIIGKKHSFLTTVFFRQCQNKRITSCLYSIKKLCLYISVLLLVGIFQWWDFLKTWWMHSYVVRDLLICWCSWGASCWESSTCYVFWKRALLEFKKVNIADSLRSLTKCSICICFSKLMKKGALRLDFFRNPDLIKLFS